MVGLTGLIILRRMQRVPGKNKNIHQIQSIVFWFPLHSRIVSQIQYQNHASTLIPLWPGFFTFHIDILYIIS